MTIALAELTVVTLAVSSLSLTLTKSHLLEPLRTMTRHRSLWLGRALGCPYCAAHWLSGLGIYLTLGPLSLASWLLATFAMVTVSSLLMGIIIQLLGLGQHELDTIQRQLNETQNALETLLAHTETP